MCGCSASRYTGQDDGSSSAGAAAGARAASAKAQAKIDRKRPIGAPNLPSLSRFGSIEPNDEFAPPWWGKFIIRRSGRAGDQLQLAPGAFAGHRLGASLEPVGLEVVVVGAG